MSQCKQMKWWGWGDEDVTFSIDDKPDLIPFILKEIKQDKLPERKSPISFDDIKMPTPNLNEDFLNQISEQLNKNQIAFDKQDRLVHAYGKSYRDLWRIRQGIVTSAPDCVIYPQTEEDVVEILSAANSHDVVVVPFGGGSNIVGCVEVRKADDRMSVSLDMKLMNKVLDVNFYSNCARIQAGIMGPHMEKQLRAKGVSLGHFPDSFMFSSLGGWVATRSAGMQSDQYGKIEDMVISIRMVTPEGSIVTRDVPKASTGLSIKEICIGSEGILGVITEVLMQVHKLPEKRDFYGFLFPDFKSGVAAIYECREKKLIPIVTRLNDPGKTALSFAFKTPSKGFAKILSSGMKWFLRNVKRFDLDACCFMIVGFEGDKAEFDRVRKGVTKIYKKHGAVNLGTSPGKAFSETKYDFPYIRDFVMDYNMIADVSETSTTWDNVLPLYEKALKAINQAIRDTGVYYFSGCHLSHTYHSGASLYFTFAFLENGKDGIEQYLKVKKAAEDAFMSNGGTLSHHHAVGWEHAPWIEQDISATGVKAVKAVKKGLDPKNIMNPGKIIPSEEPWVEWGLNTETTTKV